MAAWRLAESETLITAWADGTRSQDQAQPQARQRDDRATHDSPSLPRPRPEPEGGPARIAERASSRLRLYPGWRL